MRLPRYLSVKYLMASLVLLLGFTALPTKSFAQG